MLIQELLQLKEAAIKPQASWGNILKAIDDLNEGGDLHSRFKNDKGALEFIEELNKQGVNFDYDTAMHWMIETVGSFEVTHHKYKSPKGSETRPGVALMNYVLKLIGVDGDEYLHKVTEAVKEKNFRLEDSDQKQYGAVQFELKGKMPGEVKSALKDFNVDFFTEDGFTTITIENKFKAKAKKALTDLGYTQVKTW